MSDRCWLSLSPARHVSWQAGQATYESDRLLKKAGPLPCMRTDLVCCTGVAGDKSENQTQCYVLPTKTNWVLHCDTEPLSTPFAQRKRVVHELERFGALFVVLS
jgi:hypothetical protein